ncbi:MAG: hypothetical protein ACRDTJ_12905, partial [Pseudonocardiaceae bacterium]
MAATLTASIWRALRSRLENSIRTVSTCTVACETLDPFARSSPRSARVSEAVMTVVMSESRSGSTVA